MQIKEYSKRTIKLALLETQLCIHTDTYKHMHAHKYTETHTYIHTQKHTHVWIHIYEYFINKVGLQKSMIKL